MGHGKAKATADKFSVALVYFFIENTRVESEIPTGVAILRNYIVRVYIVCRN